jgi:hypothetical protein
MLAVLSQRCWRGCLLLVLPAGMKVDIDFLNPAISGMRQQWQQLPEPVRDVLPYAGAAIQQVVGNPIQKPTKGIWGVQSNATAAALKAAAASQQCSCQQPACRGDGTYGRPTHMLHCYQVEPAPPTHAMQNMLATPKHSACHQPANQQRTHANRRDNLHACRYRAHDAQCSTVLVNMCRAAARRLPCAVC